MSFFLDGSSLTGRICVSVDNIGMKSILDVCDTELQNLPVVLFERRVQPDRRSVWRGGRRDSDWINRPPGGLTRLTSTHKKVSLWRRWNKQ